MRSLAQNHFECREHEVFFSLNLSYSQNIKHRGSVAFKLCALVFVSIKHVLDVYHPDS